MIPKIIHYCWFGRNPLPEDAVMCINSWKKYLPEYEIKEWNEDNFDVNMIPYTAEAYAAKKYAFVSDFARFWILYHHGGLYFDTDVEVIKPIDDIIEKGNFMAYECPAPDKGAMAKAIAPGLGLGVNPGLGLLKKLIDTYSQMHYMIDGKLVSSKTIVNYTTEAFLEAGITKINDDIDYSSDCYIYAPEFFCPLDHHTGKLTLTEKSRTIHHYTASWKTQGEKRKTAFLNLIGPRLTKFLVFVKHTLNKL